MSKKVPKTTLKFSTKHQSEPLIVTTSHIPDHKSIKKKLNFNVYKNMSDNSNPRICNQRILEMDCDGVQSIGKSWETKTHGLRYMVGVLDKTTNEMTLVPASLINMKPYIKSYEEEEQKTLTYGEKHKEVMMKFGDNRIRKSITGKDRIRQMESNTLEEAMEEAVVNADVTHLAEETDLQHNDILPPMNLDTPVVADVFRLTDLISEVELTALLPFTKVLQECTQTHVNSWREQKKFPEFMLSRLPIIMEDDDLAHLYLSKLLYISYLITLINLPQKQLRHKTTNFPNTPSAVISNIYKKFTSQGLVEGKTRLSISDKQRNKLLCYLLALTLMVDNYAVSFSVLCKDTGIKQSQINDTYRSMGCNISKLKQPGVKGSVVTAVLKAPVKLPSIVLRKGGKKRE